MRRESKSLNQKHSYHPPKLIQPELQVDAADTPATYVYGPSCANVIGPFFRSTFYTQLPPPPLGIFDPCFKAWSETTFFSYLLQAISGVYPQESTLCTAVREQYFDASRDYAEDLFKHWGRFLPNQVKYLWTVDGPIPYMYQLSTTTIS
ncbi:hypothetical protein LSG31_08255 [Fodinisporobacter ferrooxydans]|uniref:Uncharacterized protein n=1 Tax=Fodinisporobacter ferrooxydans TaxID=2901836 RepID=A0ABY4CRE4_9BACL|nr:hypothetical protein LSG31_08255 [Alicyclobacillaceae bacterium MYW30-H2]